MGPFPSRLSDPSSWNASWVVIDDDVTIRARNYRQKLENIWEHNPFLSIVEDVRRFYVTQDLKPPTMEAKEHEAVMKLLADAIDQNDVRLVIRAYTSPTQFFKWINTHLANLVNTKDRKKLTMANSAHRMCYWGGPLDIACLLVNHPDLEKYRSATNQCIFRGMSVERVVQEQYRPGVRIINKTFVSTSKSRDVANMFLGKTADRVSCLFIITLGESRRRTALDIQDLSTFPEEEEVLILPYTTFEVVRVEYQGTDSKEIDYVIEMKEITDAQ